MAEAIAPDAASLPEGDAYTKEFVEQLKADLQRKTEEAANLKVKFAAHETRQREQLTELQPAVKEWIAEGMDAGNDYKHELAPMKQFGENLHQVENVESALPLARMISCHSAKYKRERERFSQTSATSEQLATANKELDELRSDRDTKAARIAELEGLCVERQSAAEKLQEELAKRGGVVEKFDFSLASSRESDPSGATTGGAASATPAESRPQAPTIDPLLSFVSKSGVGAARIGLSATNHHILGASGAGDSSIHAALRVA
jgi:hypothetical protein